MLSSGFLALLICVDAFLIECQSVLWLRACSQGLWCCENKARSVSFPIFSFPWAALGDWQGLPGHWSWPVRMGFSTLAGWVKGKAFPRDTEPSETSWALQVHVFFPRGFYLAVASTLRFSCDTVTKNTRMLGGSMLHEGDSWSLARCSHRVRHFTFFYYYYYF